MFSGAGICQWILSAQDPVKDRFCFGVVKWTADQWVKTYWWTVACFIPGLREGGRVEILSSVTFRDGVRELWWATDQQSELDQYIYITHNSRVNYNWTYNRGGVSNYRHQSGEESAGQAGPWRHWRRSGASAEGTDPYTTDSPVIACGDKCRHFLVYCVSYNKFHATCKIICRIKSHRNVKKKLNCVRILYIK